MNDSIPTDQDWHDKRMIDVFGLDWNSTKAFLLGKSRSELEHMLGSNGLLNELFVYMPTCVLEYYLPAYLDYLYSERSRGDADHASAFLHFTESEAREIQRLSTELQERVHKTVEHVASNQIYYEASPEIYGSFEELGAKSLSALQRRRPKWWST